MEWRDMTGDVRDIWHANGPVWDAYMGEEGNFFHKRLIIPSTDKLLELQPGWDVLEIGCGNGSFSRRMAAQAARVTGFDISESFIDIARARTPETTENVSFHVIDATDEAGLLALGEGRFDAAVANMALMDIPAIDPLLSALRRLLKPGGRFVFTIMHPCFNSNQSIFMMEMEDVGGEMVTRRSLKIAQYVTPVVWLGLGIPTQERPHYYFHRPLHDLFGHFFRHGFVLTGMEEPVFDGTEGGHELSWGRFDQISPVLAARMALLT